MTGWIAALLLALGVFAAVADGGEQAPSAEPTAEVATVSLTD
ncbi:MAG: hypothetical protein AAF547_20180 [Actinomycetota bacterium]